MHMIKEKERSGKRSVVPLLLNSETEIGLSRSAFGENVVTKKKRNSFFSIFKKNLGDPVIRILLFALALNVLFMLRGKDWYEGAGIAISVLCATLISSFSEYRRDSAFEKLERCMDGTVKVLRGGGWVSLPHDRLVVGDIIELSAGERISADCILIDGSVSVNTAALTGESEEVLRRSDSSLLSSFSARFRSFLKCGESEPVLSFATEREPNEEGSVFDGCFVCSGIARAYVFAVGDKTRLGQLSDSLSGEDEVSPLRERLDVLAKQISKIGYIASALIALAYLFNVFFMDCSFSSPLIIARFSDLRFVASALLGALTLALTVIVVAVPEGLPMMIAVVLARNASKMAKDNVLVRKAPGIEAAGCMNILFTDKTGTLTCGSPEICALVTPDGEYVSREEFAKVSPIAEELFSLSALYNTSASLSPDGSVISSNTAERVLLSFLRGHSLSAEVESYLPFDSNKKYSETTVCRDGERIRLIKGAPEILLSEIRYYFSREGKRLPLPLSAFSSTLSLCAKRGERIILIGASIGGGPLSLVCAVAMKDPLREDAAEAVSDLKSAGVHVVMVTGDGKETAEKIASDCKILSASHPLSLSGAELSSMSDDELSDCLDRLAVVFRAMPEHKRRLVKIAKMKNLTCGMTGDGLNDAPALKAADCGFSLGCGTEVSKHASDIIILDDRLSSVVNSVMHGRNIFKSIRKFITLQLIMNFTAMAVSMVGPFIGIDAPVTVVQMLWINIVMDTLGGLAFSGEVAERRLLKEKPKRRDEPVINRETAAKVFRLSTFSAALCFFFLKSPFVHSLYGTAEGSLYHLTAFFALFIFAGAFNCFNARTERLNMFAGITKNPTFIAIIALVATVQTVFIYFGSSVMRTVPLSASHLLLTVIFALPVILFEQVAKVFVKLSRKQG